MGGKTIKRGLSLAMALAAVMATGCGGGKAAGGMGPAGRNTAQLTDGAVAYPVAGAGTFTYGMGLSTAWSDRYNSYGELPLGKELEKRTGFKMQMVHVENSQAMNLLLASGDLPDLITYNYQTSYSGGEAKANQEGLIYAMSEDFIRKNAPDYWKVISSDPNILKQVKTPEGNIFGFAFILGDELLKTGYGLIVRDDWCRELGLDLPETADEYYAMLKAFKEKKGVEIPLCVNTSSVVTMLQNGNITSPFGLVTMDTYVDQGKVRIGYEQPEFKDALAWLRKLYAEKLLDRNFATVDTATITSNMLTGKSGASSGACGSVLGTWLTTNRNVPGYSLAGIRNLAAKRGDRPLYGHYNTDVVGALTTITSACGNPELMARFANYGYTEAGHMLYNFGIEGESYEMKDGKPVFTDLVLHNPAGLTPQQALSEYELAYNNGPFVQDKDYLLQYYTEGAQKEALKRWSDMDAKKYKLPRITISADDSAEYASLLSELETYRNEMIIKFIRSEEPIENYDAYVKTLKSMGIDHVREIVQNAVDEYNAR